MASTTENITPFLELLFKSFRSVDCRFCHKHMGFEGRYSTMIAYCSADCIERMMMRDGSALVSVACPSARQDQAVVDGGTGLAPMGRKKTLEVPTPKIGGLGGFSVGVGAPGTASSFIPFAPKPPPVRVDGNQMIPTQVITGRIPAPVFQQQPQTKVVQQPAAPMVQKFEAPGAQEPATPVVQKVAARVEQPAAPVVQTPVVEQPAAPAPMVQKVAAPAAQPPAAIVLQKVAAPAAQQPTAPVVQKVAAPFAQQPVVPVAQTPITTSGRKVFMLNEMKMSPVFVQGGVVFVSYTYDGSKFHVCGEDQTEQFALQSKIAMDVIQMKLEKLNRIPIVGEILIGDYGGEFYRALVTAVDEDKKIACLEYVDFGDYGTAGFGELFIPNEEIMKEPLYGMACRLYGVPEGTKLPKTVALRINQEPLKLGFKSGVPGYGADVVFKSGVGDGDCINHLIMSEIFREQTSFDVQ